jgi:hypothetical protein
MTATNGNFTGAITGGTIKIGNNFKVENDGTMTAKNGNFTGEINSKLGMIGGWRINETTLEGTVDGKSSGIYLDAPNAAICGGRLKPTLNNEGAPEGPLMELWGALTIKKSNGGSITGEKNNYIGYIASALPNAKDKNGIGLVIEDVGEVKITEANAALSYKSMFISLGSDEMRLSTNSGGTNTNALPIYLEGGMIYLHSNKGLECNVPAEQQKGIYARFA